MLADPRCVLCQAPGPAVCPACARTLTPAPSMACPLGLDACRALLHYDAARPLITALKNGGRRDLIGWIAPRLAPLVRAPAGAVVTWAPTGRVRRHARGFDQAELLARALARRWGLPCRALLRRDPGPAQAGRSAGERQRNPSFTARGAVAGDLVLVDDVVTTGATLSAAARALRGAGACSVHGVVAARAPGRRV